jgi:hypothetical protein
MDKKIIKDRMVPHFPIKVVSTTISIASEGIPENEVYEKFEYKSNNEEKTRFDSVEASSKFGRLASDFSSSTEKSSVSKNRISLTDSRYLTPKVQPRFLKMAYLKSLSPKTSPSMVVTIKEFNGIFIKNERQFFISSPSLFLYTLLSILA